MPTSLWHGTSKSLRPTLWSACLADNDDDVKEAEMRLSWCNPSFAHHRCTIANISWCKPNILCLHWQLMRIQVQRQYSLISVVAPTITWSGFQLYTKRVEEPGENYHRWSKYPAATTNHHPLNDIIQKLCGGESWDLHIWNIALQYIKVTVSNGEKSAAIQKVMTNFEKLALFNSRCHISSEKGERSVGGQSSPDNSRVARFPKEFSQNLATDPTVGH